MIESYDFGRMVVDGKTYSSDVVIYPDLINSSWWRKSGHRLCLEDLDNVFKENPEILVIGTGFMGLMKVEEEVKQYVKKKGISLYTKKTKNAVQIFNDLSSQKKTIGAFHLTC